MGDLDAIVRNLGCFVGPFPVTEVGFINAVDFFVVPVCLPNVDRLASSFGCSFVSVCTVRNEIVVIFVEHGNYILDIIFVKVLFRKVSKRSLP